MSDVAPDNFLRKLRYTPARDLVRGRISGRLDVKGTIARSGLPAPAKELIQRVVKRTRLWLSEKVDLADELIAHFLDGIEAGASVESLIEKFGDERKAAKLIRRAKKRNRPLAWHVLRGLGWIILVMLAVYAFLAARFVLGRPSPKVDYVAALNKPILAAPEDQRAWPIYRQAILGIGEREKKDAVNRLNEIFDARPGTEHWAKVGPWLKEHQRVVELTREGAQRPIVGFILGKNGSINDAEVYPGRAQLMSRDEGLVISILLPHLSDLRLLASVLALDARFARQQEDKDRVIKDVEALLKLSEQLHRDSNFIVMDLVAMSLWEIGLQEAEKALADQRLRLNNGDLQDLAHLLSRRKVAADVLSFAGERMMIHDVVQRCYTDDGEGDGHLTLEGEKFLKVVGAIMGAPSGGAPSRGYNAVLIEVANTALAALGSSRKQVLDKYDRMMDVAEANLRRPLRQANWAPFQEQAIGERSVLNNVRRPVSAMILPYLGINQSRAERFLGHRDGIVVGIALELYRRKHGEYPENLDGLVPEYLPQVPADRISGDSVKYKLANGKPLIYSVGADQDDDGGRMPAKKSAQFEPADWFISKEKAVDGDWVLFPQIEQEPQ